MTWVCDWPALVLFTRLGDGQSQKLSAFFGLQRALEFSGQNYSDISMRNASLRVRATDIARAFQQRPPKASVAPIWLRAQDHRQDATPGRLEQRSENRLAPHVTAWPPLTGSVRAGTLSVLEWGTIERRQLRRAPPQVPRKYPRYSGRPAAPSTTRQARSRSTWQSRGGGWGPAPKP